MRAACLLFRRYAVAIKSDVASHENYPFRFVSGSPPRLPQDCLVQDIAADTSVKTHGRKWRKMVNKQFRSLALNIILQFNTHGTDAEHGVEGVFPIYLYEGLETFAGRARTAPNNTLILKN